MVKTIELNGREVRYHLERKQVKNVNLRIKADQSVHVSANARVSEAVVEAFLHSKATYILRALDHYSSLAKHAPKPKQYTDGEAFRILGRERRLKVVAGKKNFAECDEDTITLTVKDTADLALKQKTMENWRKQYCKEILTSVCESGYPTFQIYGIGFPQLRFRNMVSRWGSCQPSRGILTFNIALIETPLACIEYVVAHEFTHFLQPNHSKAFYGQLAMFMPDWQERKKLLETARCGVE